MSGEVDGLPAEEARAMVLSLALNLAKDVVDRSEAAELTTARLDDEVPALGAVWHMSAIYIKTTQTVQITGIAVPTEEKELEGAQAVEAGGVLFFSAEDLKRLFGANAQQEANFQFVVPVAWVQLAAMATRMD